MDAQGVNLLSRSAVALEWLEEIIDDPQAKAVAKLRAVRVLKICLFWLITLAESRQAPPDLRKGIIEVLRQIGGAAWGSGVAATFMCRADNVGNLVVLDGYDDVREAA